MAEGPSENENAQVESSDNGLVLRWESCIAETLRAIGMEPSTFVSYLVVTEQHLSEQRHHHPDLAEYLAKLREYGDLNQKQVHKLLYCIFGELYLYWPKRLSIPKYANFYFKRQHKLEKIIANLLDDYGFTREAYDEMENFVQNWCKKSTPFRALRKLREHWWEHIGKDNPNFNTNDLQLFGNLNYLIMQGPHCALLAVHDNRSSSETDYCQVLNKDECPMQEEQQIGQSFFGPVMKVRHKGEPWACKRINMRRVFNNIRRGMRRKDNPQNEVPTHQYLEMAYDQDQPDTPERCPFIIGYKGICIPEVEEESDKTLHYFQEYGQDYLTMISPQYRRFIPLWVQTLKKVRASERNRYKQTHRSPWETYRGIEWLQQVRAVYDMHLMGIAHRDMKLENVVYENIGKNYFKTKCIDFGVAYRFGMWERDEMRCRDSVGTLQYMSPECFVAGRKNKALTHKLNIQDCTTYSAKANDVWCLGMMFFSMVAGEQPYRTIGIADKQFQYITAGKYLSPNDRNSLNYNIPSNSILALLKSMRRHMMITDHAINLMSKIFVPEKERITMEEIFEHPWVKEIRKDNDGLWDIFPRLHSDDPIDEILKPMKINYQTHISTSHESSDFEAARIRRDMQYIIDDRNNECSVSTNFLDASGSRIQLISTGGSWTYVRNGVARILNANVSFIPTGLLIEGKSLGYWTGRTKIRINAEEKEYVESLINKLKEKIGKPIALRPSESGPTVDQEAGITNYDRSIDHMTQIEQSLKDSSTDNQVAQIVQSVQNLSIDNQAGQVQSIQDSDIFTPTAGDRESRI